MPGISPACSGTREELAHRVRERKQPRSALGGWRGVALGLVLGVALSAGLRWLTGLRELRRSWWNPELSRPQEGRVPAPQPARWAPSPPPPASFVPPVPPAGPREEPIHLAQPRLAPPASAPVQSPPPPRSERDDVAPENRRIGGSEQPQRAPAGEAGGGLPEVVLDPDAQLRKPGETEGWILVDPRDEADMRAVAEDALAADPDATREQVLAAWRVHRGATVDEAEAEKLYAVFDRLRDETSRAA